MNESSKKTKQQQINTYTSIYRYVHKTHRYMITKGIKYCTGLFIPH